VFNPGTCFDATVTDKLNEHMPKNVAYLGYKDLQPRQEMTKEMQE